MNMPKIVIVEDDPDVAGIIKKVLQDFAFQSLWSRSAGDLFKSLAESEILPDLCIIDLGLPDMDGIEAMQKLQQIHPDCGILILTGRAHISDRVMGLELGADDYMLKPFEPRELVARVRSILRRKYEKSESEHNSNNSNNLNNSNNSSNSDNYNDGEKIADEIAGNHKQNLVEFAGWSFNFENNALISPNNEEHLLNSSEAELLKIFLANPNKILQRETLFQNLKSNNSANATNANNENHCDRSIDVRISRLRKKLEINPNSPTLIKTVYGAGYLFMAEVVYK